MSPPLACPLFRKEFQVKGAIRRATLYGSALGLYRLHINGQPVGNDYFTPDWTDYQKRVYYNTYDVTDLVRRTAPTPSAACWAPAGTPAQSAGIGQNIYGDRPRLFAQLEIELADGTSKPSPPTARGRPPSGRTSKARFLAGETYDATKEIPGWASPGLQRRRLAAGGRHRFDSGQAPGVSRRHRAGDRRACSR